MSSINTFSITKQGHNHIKDNKVGEDCSGSYNGNTMFTNISTYAWNKTSFDETKVDDELSNNKRDVFVCVVADGHGSDNYPRANKGSEYAVEVSINAIKRFVNEIDENELLNDKHSVFEKTFAYNELKTLTKRIVADWYDLIIKDYNDKKFDESELKKVDERYKTKYASLQAKDISIDSDIKLKNIVAKAYGTTLIAFVFTLNYCFGIQIGDGKCVVIDEEGNFFEPIPWDDQCQFNVTTSICDSNSIDEFRFYFNKNKPVAVFCGSDGIDDSFANSEELMLFYKSILRLFSKTDFSIVINELREYLPVLTKKGSGDDVSIAGIIDFDRLNTVKKYLEKKGTNNQNNNVETFQIVQYDDYDVIKEWYKKYYKVN